MKNVVRVFNIAYIVVLTILICLIRAFFFLGSHQTHDDIKKNLPYSFFPTLMGGLLIGLFGTIILLFVNFIYNRTIGKRKGEINMKQLLTTLIIATIISSLIGTTIFFTQ
jgi:hypothetical protein